MPAPWLRSPCEYRSCWGGHNLYMIDLARSRLYRAQALLVGEPGRFTPREQPQRATQGRPPAVGGSSSL